MSKLETFIITTFRVSSPPIFFSYKHQSREMLMQGFSIEAQDNTVCTFGSDLIDKYEKGIKQNNFKRKDGAEIERLKQISLAVMALKKPNKGIWVLNGHNPPQIAYLHASRNTGFCVYIDQETKKVRAYMPVSNVRKKIEELKIKSGAI